MCEYLFLIPSDQKVVHRLSEFLSSPVLLEPGPQAGVDAYVQTSDPTQYERSEYSNDPLTTPVLLSECYSTYEYIH